MGERFDSDLYGDYYQKKSEERIAEMTTKKVLEAQESKGRYYYSARTTKPQTPPKVKDVLLKTWAQDTAAMASLMLFHDPVTGLIGACGIDGNVFKWFSYLNDAIAAQIAYLNSAAEAGK